MLEKRVSTKDAFSKEDAVIAGWVEEYRDLKKIKFIILRDVSGTIQITLPKTKVKPEVFEQEFTKESVIAVRGKMVPSKDARGGKEMIPDEIQLISKSESPLPIDISEKIETDLSKKLDYRYIDLRRPRNLAIFKLRAEITRSVRDFLASKGFIEMQTPKLIGMGAEGGATLFALKDYYGKKAYLAQSQQFYKQLMQIAGFERVFEIGPSFRAEKSHTVRHMTEFSHIDVEMSFIKDLDDVLKIEEELLAYVLNSILKNCKKEIELLNLKIEPIKLPVPRINYAEAIKLLQEEEVKIKDGEDIGTENEKLLGEIIKKKYKSDAYFLQKFPWQLDVCKFYSMREKDVGLVADFEYKGQELSTGAQREHRIEMLRKQIKEKGLNEKDFEYYIEPFKYGAPPHGGFGMGLDRLVQFILDLQNIREAVLFPRDPERLAP